jgi:hypothetical protein
MGYIVGYFNTLRSIKMERFNFVSKFNNFSNCSKFVLDKQHIKEIKFEFWNDKEFEFHGKMYDVVYTDEEHGVKVVFALIDTKESNFLEKFKFFMNNSIDGKSIVIEFFEFVSNIVQSKLIDFTNLFPSKIESSVFVNNSLIVLQNCYLEILKPPPNAVNLKC